MQHPRVPILCALVLSACASAGTPAGDDDTSGPPDARTTEAPDAEPIGPHPDAAPGPIDAMPGPIDAMPIDACVHSTQQILANGNLDGTPVGTGWTQQPQNASFPPIVAANEMPPTLQPQSPSNAIWLGGIYSSTDALYQQVTIPATTTSIQITGYKWFVTGETGTVPADFMRVQIRSTADAVLETVQQWSNVDSNTGWTTFSLTVTGNYAGQTIRVYLQAQTNADPTPLNPNDNVGNSNFFLDSLAVNVVACP